MKNFVEFSSAEELKSYAEEVKKNNLSIIGTASESPLEVGEYEGTITGNMSSSIITQTCIISSCCIIYKCMVS